jgi:hypothetical protein
MFNLKLFVLRLFADFYLTQCPQILSLGSRNDRSGGNGTTIFSFVFHFRILEGGAFNFRCSEPVLM